MKKFIVILSVVGLLGGLSSCQNMSRSTQGTTQFTNPSKHHPYPVSAKNRANQKH